MTENTAALYGITPEMSAEERIAARRAVVAAAAADRGEQLPTFEIVRLDRGRHRVGLTRNGEIVAVYARVASVARDLKHFQDYVELIGRESEWSRYTARGAVVWNESAGRYMTILRDSVLPDDELAKIEGECPGLAAVLVEDAADVAEQLEDELEEQIETKADDLKAALARLTEHLGKVAIAYDDVTGNHLRIPDEIDADQRLRQALAADDAAESPYIV